MIYPGDKPRIAKYKKSMTSTKPRSARTTHGSPAFGAGGFAPLAFTGLNFAIHPMVTSGSDALTEPPAGPLTIMEERHVPLRVGARYSRGHCAL